ncbi:MAG: flavodoxin domain-containing protein [Bacillus sp. (in: Bacteria)]|nr:flavodoxin domain-containing protein [Bacillus sp. (in: firmicutes)]
MKSLIIYCSSHGTTEKAVRLLTENLQGEVLAVDLKKDKNEFDLKSFDTVIIGGSIHAGQIQRKLKQFMKDNHDVLVDKSLGLFLCCMRDGDAATEQFNNAFPQELRKETAAMGLFGGEFLVTKMNFFERQIVKKVDGIIEDQSKLDNESIMLFASKLNNVKSLV